MLISCLAQFPGCIGLSVHAPRFHCDVSLYASEANKMENLLNLFFSETSSNEKCLADSTAAPAADGDKGRGNEL